MAGMNLTKEVRGVSRIAGEMLCAVPDVREALDRLEAIERSMTRHLAELSKARHAERLVVLALNADLELLAEELQRDGVEWDKRRDELALGARDLGLTMPGNPLGFRIVTTLPYPKPAGLEPPA